VVEDAGMAARRAVLGGAAALLAAGAPAAQEAAYPSRPVRLIVALGAGGDVDLVTRVVGHRMAELLGQPLVVENRPGAGSLVGHEAAARAVPDGYTLIMSTISALTANLALYDRLPYDPVHDFVPVVYVGNAPGVLVVPPASPWQAPVDIVTAARARPGALTYASAGNGNLTHLMGEVFKQRNGIDLVHVPYRAVTEAQRDLGAGRVDLMFAVAPSTLPLILGEKLRPLAITAGARLAALPGVPTMAEHGFADFEISSWFGLMAPRGVPASIVAAVNAAANEALRTAAVRARLAAMSVNVAGGTPEAFGAYIAAERARWVPVVRQIGVRVD
jgi:tripartite-type tricarboxylate transporter receptor subunit TctC